MEGDLVADCVAGSAGSRVQVFLPTDVFPLFSRIRDPCCTRLSLIDSGKVAGIIYQKVGYNG